MEPGFKVSSNRPEKRVNDTAIRLPKEAIIYGILFICINLKRLKEFTLMPIFCVHPN